METLKKVSFQTFFQLIGKFVSVFCTFIVLGLITRTYGADGTGVFTLTLTYLAFFFLAADLGFNAYVLPRLEEGHREAGRLFNFRLSWSVILVILCIMISFLIPTEEGTVFRLSVAIGSLSIIFSASFNTFNLIFQKNLRYDLSVIASCCGALITIPLVFLLIFLNVPIEWLMSLTLIGWITNGLVAYFLVKKFYVFKISPGDFSYGLNVLKNAWPITLTLVLNILYFRLDAFILNSYFGFSVTGQYNLAYQVFQNALVVPTFIMNGFYPLMIVAFEKSRILFWKQILVAALILLSISVVGSILTFYLSPLVIYLLSGGGFSESVESLKTLSFAFPAYFLSALLMWVFLVMKKYKTLATIYIIGLLVNILLNLYFIPKYSYQAASSITGFSEYLILLLQIVTLLRLSFTKKQ